MATQTKARQADPVVVDSKHYKVEMEDEKVRVLHIHYGPGERSVMHGHPTSVAICLTEAHVRFTSPDGTTEEMHATAGRVMPTPAGEHLPENIGDRPFDIVLVELKR